jgi:hypothetical protein
MLRAKIWDSPLESQAFLLPIIFGQRLDTLDACLLSALVSTANDYPPNTPCFTDEVCRQDFLANRDRMRGLVRLRADETNFAGHLPGVQVD